MIACVLSPDRRAAAHRCVAYGGCQRSAAYMPPDGRGHVRTEGSGCSAKYNPQRLRPRLHRKANRTAAAPMLPLGCVSRIFSDSVDETFIMNYELPCVLIRFGSEFILSNAKTRCAAAVRAQHGDALGHVTWSWQRGWATSMQPSSFHSLCRPLSSGPSGRSPSAWRQAAAATRGGSTARLRLAGRGGVIAARRYCEGMQQRRPCFVRWRI